MSIDVVNVQPAGASPSVSWSAIAVGSVVAAATTIALVVLAAGLGLSVASPWMAQNPSAKTFAMSTAIGLIVVQWIASFLGGYIAGRLRPDWEDSHPDERFFRDTAHGFAVWCVGTIIVACLTFALASSVARGAGEAAKTVAGAAQSIGGSDAVQQYTTDLMFRGGANSVPPERRAEAARIVAIDVATGDFPQEDRAYLAQLVSSASGLSPDDAKTRVDRAIANLDQAKTKAQQAAEEARKVAARSALFGFLSLLIGAFIASVAAAWGGSLRDEVSA